jgi:hypothetical protein
MQIVLAYMGRVRFFNISLTQLAFVVIALPWAIQLFQGLVKKFLPGAEFDPVTGSIYDPEFNDERDEEAVENYLDGYYDPESSGAISRYRQRRARSRHINR